MPSLIMELHPVDIEPGHWCEVCALPSVVRVSMVAADADTLRPMMRCVVLVCEECGGQAIEGSKEGGDR